MRKCVSPVVRAIPLRVNEKLDAAGRKALALDAEGKAKKLWITESHTRFRALVHGYKQVFH